MVSGRRATATWVVVDPGGGWFATLVLRGHVFSAVSLVSRWYIVANRVSVRELRTGVRFDMSDGSCGGSCPMVIVIVDLCPRGFPSVLYR